MIRPRDDLPPVRVPAGHRRAGNIVALLKEDSTVFGADFPPTDENLAALLAELRSHPECYHRGSDSFSTERIADWLIRNLEGFRRSRSAAVSQEETVSIRKGADEEIRRLRDERDEALASLKLGKDSADVSIREARLQIASLEVDLRRTRKERDILLEDQLSFTPRT